METAEEVVDTVLAELAAWGVSNNRWEQMDKAIWQEIRASVVYKVAEVLGMR